VCWGGGEGGGRRIRREKKKKKKKEEEEEKKGEKMMMMKKKKTPSQTLLLMLLCPYLFKERFVVVVPEVPARAQHVVLLVVPAQQLEHARLEVGVQRGDHHAEQLLAEIGQLRRRGHGRGGGGGGGRRRRRRSHDILFFRFYFLSYELLARELISSSRHELPTPGDWRL
jgi:hypothetical protein